MQRHNCLKFLSHDHHHGLMLSQLIKKGAPRFKTFPNSLEGKRQYTIQFYQVNLSNHFYEEENLLFPFVKGKDDSIDNLCDELINEHKIITQFIHSLEDKTDIEEKLDQLGILLTSHIRKEERELFLKIQHLFNDEDLLSLEQKLKRTG